MSHVTDEEVDAGVPTATLRMGVAKPAESEMIATPPPKEQRLTPMKSTSKTQKANPKETASPKVKASPKKATPKGKASSKEKATPKGKASPKENASPKEKAAPKRKASTKAMKASQKVMKAMKAKPSWLQEAKAKGKIKGKGKGKGKELRIPCEVCGRKDRGQNVQHWAPGVTSCYCDVCMGGSSSGDDH